MLDWGKKDKNVYRKRAVGWGICHSHRMLFVINAHLELYKKQKHEWEYSNIVQEKSVVYRYGWTFKDLKRIDGDEGRL